MRKWVFAITAVTLTLNGCGQGPTGGPPSPSASGKPTGSSPPVTASGSFFAVLETRHCPAVEPAACESAIAATHDTVAIAGLDGYAKAKATFLARSIPDVGAAATLTQPEGQVANGAVYFIDGKGVVRRLEPGGAVRTVATFPLTSPQQEVSFAVSPDGKQVMAAMLTFPTHHPSADTTNSPFGTFTGPFVLEVDLATAGGPTRLVKRWQSAADQYPNQPGGFTNIAVVAWDAEGPIALMGAATGTQNAVLNNQRWFGGSLARLHTDGSLGPPIGPTGCVPYRPPLNARFVCTGDQGPQGATPVKVVSIDGSVLWSGTAHPAGSLLIAGDFAISPDGTRLAMDGEIVNLRNGSVTHFLDGFWPQGWLASDTLIGVIPSPHTAGTIGVLRLSDPQHPENWRFSGSYVGVVT